MNFVKTLSRNEMKHVMAGDQVWMECDNCADGNPTCQGWVDDCSISNFYQMCGPGRVGEGGEHIPPEGRCVAINPR